jgi:cytochrome c oxidase subunit II
VGSRRADSGLTVIPPLDASWTNIWQSLYSLYWTLAVGAGVITIGALIFMAIRYRGKAGSKPSIHADEKTHFTAVIIMVVVMAAILSVPAVMSFQAIGTYDHIPNDPNAVHVNVTGQRFSWSFSCTTNCDNHTAGELFVPANTEIIMNITSIDVFHSFKIPQLKVGADAIPGRYNVVWFTATEGIYTIQCFELCGPGHALMIAQLHVVAGPVS